MRALETLHVEALYRSTTCTVTFTRVISPSPLASYGVSRSAVSSPSGARDGALADKYFPLYLMFIVWLRFVNHLLNYLLTYLLT